METLPTIRRPLSISSTRPRLHAPLLRMLLRSLRLVLLPRRLPAGLRWIVLLLRRMPTIRTSSRYSGVPLMRRRSTLSRSCRPRDACLGLLPSTSIHEWAAIDERFCLKLTSRRPPRAAPLPF